MKKFNVLFYGADGNVIYAAGGVEALGFRSAITAASKMYTAAGHQKVAIETVSIKVVKPSEVENGQPR